MNQLLELSFQIEEDVLNEAVIRLEGILDDIDANAMVEDDGPSKETALRVLLSKLSKTPYRFPVEPGYEEEEEVSE